MRAMSPLHKITSNPRQCSPAKSRRYSVKNMSKGFVVLWATRGERGILREYEFVQPPK